MIPFSYVPTFPVVVVCAAVDWKRNKHRGNLLKLSHTIKACVVCLLSFFPTHSATVYLVLSQQFKVSWEVVAIMCRQ